MATVELDRAALNELTASFRGELVEPGGAGYEEHRKVWNGSIHRHPALIARCSGTEDVVAALRFARETGVPLAVRGGGHSFPGHSVCDGGVVVDMGTLNARQRRSGSAHGHRAGWRPLGQLDSATQAFGLAPPPGIVTHTGLAGLTLGGGIGWLQRKFGLTIDQLRSVEMVTAGGELVRASEEENADLFWGLRGGGAISAWSRSSSFASTRSARRDGGPGVLANGGLAALLRFYRDWIAEAPDDLMTIVIHRKAPPLDFIPPELHGELVVAVVACYAGPRGGGARARPSSSSDHPCSTFASRSPTSSTRGCSTRPTRTGAGTTCAPVTSPSCRTR